MTYLFFDTDTTGLPDMNRPAGAEFQPRICQLGAIVTDGEGRIKMEVNLLVKPDGWSIPQAASDVHGISQEAAEAYGLSIKGVLSILDRMMNKAEMIVAHNINFDLFMLHIEAERADMSLNIPQDYCCTMKDATELVKAPPTAKMMAMGMQQFKRPSLQEAYRHFFGQSFEGAHDAMADVRACKDVFFRIMQSRSLAV